MGLLQKAVEVIRIAPAIPKLFCRTPSKVCLTIKTKVRIRFILMNIAHFLPTYDQLCFIYFFHRQFSHVVHFRTQAEKKIFKYCSQLKDRITKNKENPSKQSLHEVPGVLYCQVFHHHFSRASQNSCFRL